MTKLKFALVVFTTGLGILFLAAWVIPRFWLANDDNIERLAGGDPKAVEYAREVRWLIGHGHYSQLPALRCTGVKIVELQPMDAMCSNDKLAEACLYPYQRKVVVYGLFKVRMQAIASKETKGDRLILTEIKRDKIT